MIPVYVLKALFAAAGVALIRSARTLAAETKRPWARWTLHALAGLAALLTGNALGALKGLGIGLNGFTAGLSALLGLPGVCLLWGIKYLL